MVPRRCINCFEIPYKRSFKNRDPIVPRIWLKLLSACTTKYVKEPQLSDFILLVHLGNGPFEAEAKLLPGLEQEQSPVDFVIVLPYNPLMMCQWHIGPTLNKLTAVGQWLTFIYQTWHLCDNHICDQNLTVFRMIEPVTQILPFFRQVVTEI